MLRFFRIAEEYSIFLQSRDEYKASRYLYYRIPDVSLLRDTTINIYWSHVGI